MENRLFATGWVHAFEEDTAEGAVYRPRGSKLPLSRRPRERLELDADGTARIFVQGPDDRYIEQPASWHDEDGVRRGSRARGRHRACASWIGRPTGWSSVAGGRVAQRKG